MMKYWYTGCLALFVFTNAFAQSVEDKAFIIENTNVERLHEIVKEHQEIQEKYKHLPIKEVMKDEEGNTLYFSHFDAAGTPIYYSLENESSAISSKIDRIRIGGSTGLDLDGDQIEFGLWDGGSPRTTHQEFDANITVIDAATTSHHATHIAGILIAEGIVPEAKGMAPGATIRSYTSSGWASEVPLWAASGGMISSHSYIIANPQTNYELYGIYNVHSQSWDEMSYNAPYLIMCTGASNNGNNNYNPDNSRYDLLASNKLGKNSIVIGACSDVLNYTGPSDVNQAVFTSWGPTDDWRIKPDITAVGVSSYSTREASDSDYSTGQGCSYAAPIVSGGLALLQQHYHDMNGVYMKATTAKALILSTTDEAGTHDGPDFSNGWGLFNAEKAAAVITNESISSIISELTLNDNQTISFMIEVDSTAPLSAAICWNDPAAIPLTNPSYNDSTLMLINDLDIRISSDTAMYYPWRMEPNATYDNYTDPASKGDNYRDNIEVIDVENLPAGFYSVTINHKGTLQSGAQDFSLVINGARFSNLSSSSVIADQDELTVYPNPTNHHVTIEWNDPSSKWVNVSVYNLNGEQQLERQVTHQNTIDLDVSTLPKGVYVLKIEDEQATTISTQKLIVQ